MLVKITNGSPEIYSIGQLRKDNPNTSFPKNINENTLAQYDVYTVVDEPHPVFNQDTQRLQQGSVVGSGTSWTRGWNIIELTPEEVSAKRKATLAFYEKAIQNHLDSFATTKSYDSILSATTYATSSVPQFAKEGKYCVDLRDSTWNTAGTILAEVESGIRSAPTIDELIAMLPVPSWPV